MLSKYVVSFVGLLAVVWTSAAVAGELDLATESCKPLALKRQAITHPQVPDSLKVVNLDYSACDGKPLKAYLISSSNVQAGKQPAILYVHWFDPRVKNSNREEFVAEAVAYVQKGGVTLLVSTFWSVPGGYYDKRRWQDDYSNTVSQLRDLRRELQLLRTEPGVDAKKIVYVGHDYGAVFGAMLAPYEPEVAGWALSAGAADISSWYLYGSASGVPTGDDLKKYLAQFAPIQPYVLLKKSSAPVLLQYAKADEFINDEQQQKMRSSMPKGSIFKVYESNHAMELPAIRVEREQWVSEKLGSAPGY
jgi:dienelactone hydrolase